MPLSFPNTWGVKKDWGKRPPQREEPEDDECVVNDDEEMKCPSCGQWVDHFNYSADYVEFGTIDRDGDINGDSLEFDCMRDITCPKCGDSVFDSISELTKYYR